MAAQGQTRINSANSQVDAEASTVEQCPPAAADVAVRASSDSTLHAKARTTRAGFKRPSSWVLVFGWSLAICAGLVNAVAFRSWGLFVSHVTGSTTSLGMRLEGYQQKRGGIEDVTEALALLLSFLAGAFTCGLLIDKNQVHLGGKALYGAALIGEAALLVIAVAVSKDTLLAASLVSAACGLQNAMCTSHFGAVVRTTHVTGTVTDIGSTLGRLTMIFMRKGFRRSRLNVLERAEVGVDARKVLVLLPMWTSFLTGTVTGAYLETLIGIDALFVPAAMTGFVGVFYTFFRGAMKKSLKRLERERLNEDMLTVHQALERSQCMLQAAHNRHSSMKKSDEESSDGGDLADMDEELGHALERVHEVEQILEGLYESEKLETGAGMQHVRSLTRSNSRQ